MLETESNSVEVNVLESQPTRKKSLNMGIIPTDLIERLEPYVPVESISSGPSRSHSHPFKIFLDAMLGFGRARAILTASSLLATDGVILLSLIWIGNLISGMIFSDLAVPSMAWQFLLALTVFGILGASQGLFPGTALNPVIELRQLTITAILTMAVFAVCLLVIHVNPVSMAVLLLVIVPHTTVIMPLARLGFRHLLSCWKWWGERVIIVGSGPQADAVLQFCQRTRHRGLIATGIVHDSPAAAVRCSNQAGQGSLNTGELDPKYIGTIQEMPSLAQRYGARWCIIALEKHELEPLETINQCGELPHIIVLPADYALPSLWTGHREFAGVFGIHIKTNSLCPILQMMKRLMDIAGALICLLVGIPFLLLAVVWIKVKSPGPAFYGHKRIGAGRRVFTAWKFRTMVLNADKVLEACLDSDPSLRQEWCETQKLKDDPRIIPGIGQFLRKFSLDEFPQLWNVLVGEMSLVGPRPIVNSEIERYQQIISLYFRVRPGLTGLWQVSGRNDTSYNQRVRLDAYYVSNWSLWLDIYIIARTVRTLIRREGAY